jgi:hypothetical protein
LIRITSINYAEYRFRLREIDSPSQERPHRELAWFRKPRAMATHCRQHCFQHRS